MSISSLIRAATVTDMWKHGQLPNEYVGLVSTEQLRLYHEWCCAQPGFIALNGQARAQVNAVQSREAAMRYRQKTKEHVQQLQAENNALHEQIASLLRQLELASAGLCVPPDAFEAPWVISDDNGQPITVLLP